MRENLKEYELEFILGMHDPICVKECLFPENLKNRNSLLNSSINLLFPILLLPETTTKLDVFFRVRFFSFFNSLSRPINGAFFIELTAWKPLLLSMGRKRRSFL